MVELGQSIVGVADQKRVTCNHSAVEIGLMSDDHATACVPTLPMYPDSLVIRPGRVLQKRPVSADRAEHRYE